MGYGTRCLDLVHLALASGLEVLDIVSCGKAQWGLSLEQPERPTALKFLRVSSSGVTDVTESARLAITTQVRRYCKNSFHNLAVQSGCTTTFKSVLGIFLV